MRAARSAGSSADAGPQPWNQTAAAGSAGTERAEFSHLDAIFNAIDEDGSGTIENHELLMYLVVRGIADETIREIFKSVDCDHDGKITQAEWRKGFAKYV